MLKPCILFQFTWRSTFGMRQFWNLESTQFLTPVRGKLFGLDREDDLLTVMMIAL
jgi:hypothetical protein